jgi:hypothetical protein
MSGLIQNIASLANPAANTVRPTDILMAGQQSREQIQAGLAGIGRMMANERKQTAHDRADEAVAGLLAKAPTGTQDPTQYNQALGLVSAYGSQGMKDAARNAITSATEGYRTGLQQENFGKTFGLQEQTFNEAIRHAKELESQGRTQLSNQAASNAQTAKYQNEMLGLTKAEKEENRKMHKVGMHDKGYSQDTKGNWVLNTNSYQYLNKKNADFLSDYNKNKPTVKEFMDAGHTRDLFGGVFTFESRYLNAYNKADKFLRTPANNPAEIAIKQQLIPFMDTGDYASIEELLGK